MNLSLVFGVQCRHETEVTGWMDFVTSGRPYTPQSPLRHKEGPYGPPSEKPKFTRNQENVPKRR